MVSSFGHGSHGQNGWMVNVVFFVGLNEWHEINDMKFKGYFANAKFTQYKELIL